MAKNKKIPTWKGYLSLKTGNFYTTPISEGSYSLVGGKHVPSSKEDEYFLECPADYTFYSVVLIERITSSGIYMLNVSTGNTLLMRKEDFVEMLSKTTIYKNKIVGKFGLKKSNKVTIVYVGEE